MDGYDDIMDFYNSPALHKLQSRSCDETLFEICGITKSETAHSAFLKWLFENEEFARLPLSPVVTLLRLYAIKALRQSILVLPGDLLRRICSGEIKRISAVNAKTEVPAKNNRFIDLELDITLTDGNKIRVSIENKLFTKEHDNQCDAYVEHYKSLNDNIPTLFIFLSPDVRNYTKNQNYIHILYQELYDSVLFPLYEYYRKHHSGRSIAYLRDYIESLTSFDESFNPIVMSNEYNDLLKEIYDNHKDLFLQAISRYGTEEERKIINSINYDISYNEGQIKQAVGYTKMARAVIETLLENGIAVADVLAQLSKVDISGFDSSVVVDINNMGAQSRYQKKPIEGTSILVSNQWNKDKARKFIDLAKTKYPGLKVHG